MKFAKVFVFISFLILSSQANAYKYTCSGLVKGLSISPTSGYVLVEQLGELQWPRLCSTSEESNGIPAENCKIIYSTLLAAQLSQKTVTIWFNDSQDCSVASHPAWEALTGWYFGPKINAD